jgi:hypothetical protein
MPKNKKLEDMTKDETKELKIEFAPGCFDGFEGTQEELDELIAEITRMVKSGEILEKSRPINFDDMDDDAEIIKHIIEAEQNQIDRKIQ